jgi:hypothetical protein
MRKLIFIITLFTCPTLFANDDEDIFADIDLEAIEINRNYEDDFDGLENSYNSTSPPMLSSYDRYSQRLIAPHEQSFGGSLSQETFARVFHMTLFPKLHIKAGDIKAHLGLPLRFPLYDNALNNSVRRKGFVGIEEFITPRQADFRSFKDAFKVIRHFEYGAPDTPYYVSLVREQPLTLVQGDIMREMLADYLYDHDYLFARAHAHIKPVRIETIFGPLPNITILALGTKIRAFDFPKSHAVLNNLSIDIAYAADYKAPGEAFLEGDTYVLDEERRLIKRQHGIAQALSLGISSSYEPIWWFETRPYTSFANLWVSGLDKLSYGLAFSLGHEADFYFSGDKKSSLLFKSEARVFSEHYLPNYFGDNYMLDRVTLFEDNNNLITKAQFVNKKEDNKWRFGHLFEIGYDYNKIFNTKLSYENARIIKTNKYIKPLRKLRFTTGLAAFDRVYLQAGYEAHAIDHLGDIFNFTKSRALLFAQSQVKIISFLYANSWIKHGFGIDSIYESSTQKTWLSNKPESRSLNYGLGLEFAMVF